jgi:hypothetical protein
MTNSATALVSSQPNKLTWGRKVLVASRHGIARLRTRLGKRGLIVLGGLVIAADLALNWSWLAAIGLAPLLLTALPCMVMCAVGICMMPKTEKSIESNSAEIDSNPKSVEGTPATSPSDRVG